MNPVSQFQSTLRERFRAYLEDFLARAVKSAQIDRRENARLTKEIHHQQAALRRAERGRGWCLFLVVLFIVLGGVGVGSLYRFHFPSMGVLGLVAYALVGGGGIFFKLLPNLRRLEAQIDVLKETLNRLIHEAVSKLIPFYEKFSWETLPKLIEKTLPEVVFDPFLTHQRISEMRETYGFDFADVMQQRSMLYTHSGTFFGYPFIFYHAKRFYWGEETYTGTKYITWTTQERDANGRTRTVFHSQTLVASVTKPCPRFVEEKRFLFMHPATPNLSFSRKPSTFAGKKGFFAGMKRRSKLRKLKRFEANLTDESNYTMVANEDFEVLFNVPNRDHEVEFRMLFTPSAQQQMVALLSDTSVGYGDDFTYLKDKCLTMLYPQHLDALDFSTEPRVLPLYDFNDVLKYFRTRYAEFFRSVYFTFAPLYTIPSYQEPALQAAEAEASVPLISNWEMEAMAHWHGEEHYAHPESCTENLLWVTAMQQEGSRATATVTAVGFRGVSRVDVEYVYGRDGRLHAVAVPWIEYFDVRRERTLTVRLGTDEPPLSTRCRRSWVIED